MGCRMIFYDILTNSFIYLCSDSCIHFSYTFNNSCLMQILSMRGLRYCLYLDYKTITSNCTAVTDLATTFCIEWCCVKDKMNRITRWHFINKLVIKHKRSNDSRSEERRVGQ